MGDEPLPPDEDEEDNSLTSSPLTKSTTKKSVPRSSKPSSAKSNTRRRYSLISENAMTSSDAGDFDTDNNEPMDWDQDDDPISTKSSGKKTKSIDRRANQVSDDSSAE